MLYICSVFDENDFLIINLKEKGYEVYNNWKWGF